MSILDGYSPLLVGCDLDAETQHPIPKSIPKQIFKDP